MYIRERKETETEKKELHAWHYLHMEIQYQQQFTKHQLEKAKKISQCFYNNTYVHRS